MSTHEPRGFVSSGNKSPKITNAPKIPKSHHLKSDCRFFNAEFSKMLLARRSSCPIQPPKKTKQATENKKIRPNESKKMWMLETIKRKHFYP